MSCSYYTYIGAYLVLAESTSNVKIEKHVCSKCGKVYHKGEKFCSVDGGDIVSEDSIEKRSFGCWRGVQEAYPVLEAVSEDEFTRPEYIDDGVFLSNYSKTHHSLDGDEGAKVLEFNNKFAQESLDAFKEQHEEVLKIMDDNGIEYDIQVGAIGYWS